MTSNPFHLERDALQFTRRGSVAAYLVLVDYERFDK